MNRVVSFNNLNSLGTLFGGDLLRWFDLDAAEYAYGCIDDARMTGVCIYSFNFIVPAYEGQRIRSNFELVHVGNTSLTVKGTYEKNEDEEWIKIAQGYSCLCAIYSTGKPHSVSIKPEIDIKEIKSNKDWELVEKMKALTILDK